MVVSLVRSSTNLSGIPTKKEVLKASISALVFSSFSLASANASVVAGGVAPSVVAAFIKSSCSCVGCGADVFLSSPDVVTNLLGSLGLRFDP
jgi:hypothetical protein